MDALQMMRIRDTWSGDRAIGTNNEHGGCTIRIRGDNENIQGMNVQGGFLAHATTR